jgi:hypothetical protein
MPYRASLNRATGKMTLEYIQTKKRSKIGPPKSYNRRLLLRRDAKGRLRYYHVTKGWRDAY